MNELLDYFNDYVAAPANVDPLTRTFLCEVDDCDKTATSEFRYNDEDGSYYTFRCDDHKVLEPEYEEVSCV